MGKAVWHIDDVELALGGDAPERIAAYSTLIVEQAAPSRGGLGETWRAMTSAGEPVACKRMLMPDPSRFSSQDAFDAEVEHRRRAFREEYEALRRLSSFKGFVKARAYGSLDGAPVIVMEWVEGVSLADVMSGERLGPLAAAQIGRDVFHLLARLEWQAELFVHRDLSPANIMIRTHEVPFERQLEAGSFDICLIDFGSAATLRTGDGAFTTTTRILRGATPAYAPPEMLTNDVPHLDELRKSSRIDVYAACSVLYELLCGHPPFCLEASGDAGSDYLHKMVRDPLPAGFPENTVEGLLARIACSGIRPGQGDRPSAYALFKALGFYCDHFGQNVARARAGQPLLAMDMGAIDRPELGDGQVALSNPLSRQVSAQAPPARPTVPASRKRGWRRAAAIAAAVVAAAVGAAAFGSGLFQGSGLEHEPSVAQAPGEGSADENGIVGTWEGALASTSPSPSCFGGRQRGMSLTVKEDSGSGIACDIAVMYHGHDRHSQTGDVNSNASDGFQVWEGLVASSDGPGFTLFVDESATMGRDSSLTVACEPDEDHGAMAVTVTSRFRGAETVDEYVLER